MSLPKLKVELLFILVHLFSIRTDHIFICGCFSYLCLVVHLEGSTPTKYGLLLNNDDRYKDVKRELSKYCGLVCSQLLLVEIFGASVKVACHMEHVIVPYFLDLLNSALVLTSHLMS